MGQFLHILLDPYSLIVCVIDEYLYFYHQTLSVLRLLRTYVLPAAGQLDASEID